MDGITNLDIRDSAWEAFRRPAYAYTIATNDREYRLKIKEEVRRSVYSERSDKKV